MKVFVRTSGAESKDGIRNTIHVFADEPENEEE